MNEQIEKLARALLNGGIASNQADAEKRAREILNIPEPVEEVQPVSLDQVESVVIDKDFTSDKTLKDLLDEDSKDVYR